MNYVISDVHGRYDLYRRMLDRIGFSRGDVLHFLGDAIDRGPEGLRVLEDLMGRDNAVVLLGNHEDMLLRSAKILDRRRSLADRLEARHAYVNWTKRNGGDVTWAAFLALPEDRRQALLAWLEGLPLYEELTVGGRRFLLVHAGVGAYAENKDPADCSREDCIWERMDYDRVYYPDRYLVTGHTPTGLIDRASMGRILRRSGHIVMDCGAVFLGTLGCICLETLEEFYVTG